MLIAWWAGPHLFVYRGGAGHSSTTRKPSTYFSFSVLQFASKNAGFMEGGGGSVFLIHCVIVEFLRTQGWITADNHPLKHAGSFRLWLHNKLQLWVIMFLLTSALPAAKSDRRTFTTDDLIRDGCRSQLYVGNTEIAIIQSILQILSWNGVCRLCCILVWKSTGEKYSLKFLGHHFF